MSPTATPEQAAQALAAGELVGLPTETVYGLGALADDPAAIAALYRAKGRPADHPVIVHISGADALPAWSSSVPEYAQALAEQVWPGPLTLVLDRSPRARDDLTGTQDTVAIRVSAHPVFAEVLRHLIAITDDPATGIAAPSANRFGRVSPTRAEHVQTEFAIPVVDGGPCAIGVESTIVDCTDTHPKILRQGAVSSEVIEQITGLTVTFGSAIRAPGTLAAHYAPRATVQVIESGAAIPNYSDETGFIALADIPTPPNVVRLAEPADADAYASELYAALRDADARGLAMVLAVLPPDKGIGRAVRDRLMRAARSTSAPS